MALFPAVFAENGDCILVADSFERDELKSSPYFHHVVKKGIRIVSLEESSFLAYTQFSEFRPWGWNHTLRESLAEAGVPERLLKSPEEIDSLRDLSHRRTTIPFMEHISGCMQRLNISPAQEFYSTAEAIAFRDAHPGAYFKAPWSSSGRGVVCSSEISSEKLAQWIGGFIRRQGSVMGEIGYCRTLDFATEWNCSKEVVRFIGLSVFSTSKDGRYKGNLKLSQDALNNIISEACEDWSPEIIEAQRDALSSLIAPHYSGPVGIDMLATSEGKINPCVELNLRQTMGLISIYEYEQNAHQQ